MERRVLTEAAPVARRALLADTPAGVAAPVQGELNLDAVPDDSCDIAGKCLYAQDVGMPEHRCARGCVYAGTDASPPGVWQSVESAFAVDLDGVDGWAWDRVIYDRTRAFSETKRVPMGRLLPSVLLFSAWSRELPPTRGWWLVREQPGGEMSVLWFERVGRAADGSWHLEGDGSEGFPKGEAGLCVGMHNELTNIEWCGLAAPWPTGYNHRLDAAHENALDAENKRDAAEWMAANGFIKRRALAEAQA